MIRVIKATKKTKSNRTTIIGPDVVVIYVMVQFNYFIGFPLIFLAHHLDEKMLSNSITIGR